MIYIANHIYIYKYIYIYIFVKHPYIYIYILQMFNTQICSKSVDINDCQRESFTIITIQKIWMIFNATQTDSLEINTHQWFSTQVIQNHCGPIVINDLRCESHFRLSRSTNSLGNILIWLESFDISILSRCIRSSLEQIELTAHHELSIINWLRVSTTHPHLDFCHDHWSHSASATRHEQHLIVFAFPLKPATSTTTTECQAKPCVSPCCSIIRTCK